MKQLIAALVVLTGLVWVGIGNAKQVTGLTAVHRTGQTFLVWNESSSSAGYHVYRSSQPITSSNLSSAQLLTSRWGPLDQDTSVNKYRPDYVPQHFVVEDNGVPLSGNQGLFVYTTQKTDSSTAYYAVTSVENGSESKKVVNGANTTAQPMREAAATAKPVLTLTKNGGKGRLYTQYMDYSNWNPTLKGYAFNYSVALPGNYNPKKAYPLQLQLHAHSEVPKFEPESEYNWQVIQLFPSDVGEYQNSIHTWWYGHAADHNYVTNGKIPNSGKIGNFTEQRVIQAVAEVVSNPDFRVNTDLIHAYGHSMGASGSLSLALRYPTVLSGIYASEPMTNYAASPTFQEEFVRLWGTQSANLPIVNRGRFAGYVRKDTSGVWDWMNHQLQVRRRRAADFAYLNLDFGKDDTIIDWATQGQPMIRALTEAKAGFSLSALDNVGHNWLGFNSININQFGLGHDDKAPWRYPNSVSFVSIQNATGSGPISPGPRGNDEYNVSVEWSTPHNSFHKDIVDQPKRFEVSVRSLAGDQTMSVTPRNTKNFKLKPGQKCVWVAQNKRKKTIAQGNVTVDRAALVTAESVPVGTGKGTRLLFECT